MHPREPDGIGRVSRSLLVVCLVFAGCGGGAPSEADGTGGAAGGGGTAGTGGSSGGGGAKGTGGTGTGGTSSRLGGAGGGAGGTSTASGVGGSPPSGGSRDTGGTPGTGGVLSTGGASALAGASGGNRDAGSPADARSTGGVTGTGGTGPVATGGGTGTQGKIFKDCRFHFGTQSSKLTSALLPELDLYGAGWLYTDTFGWSGVCMDSAAGGRAAGLVPTVFAYASAGIVKTKYKLCDCNMTGCAGGDLCKYGSQYITQEWATILAAYTKHSAGFAACMGNRPIIFKMEPDWLQYTGSGQTQRWTNAEAGTKMTALVQALKSSLPNGVCSMDISPWMSDSTATSWYANFDMSLFTFINTSGGSSNGSIPKIRANNAMTWAGVFKAAGKPIIADTGYGAGGAGTGEDTTWNLAANINARMLEGVIALIQPNPGPTWGDTVKNMRSQLNAPPNCY